MIIDCLNLNAIIASQGKSYSIVADAAGISRATLSELLKTGNCRPTTAGKIANALGVKVENLLKE